LQIVLPTAAFEIFVQLGKVIDYRFPEEDMIVSKHVGVR